MIVRWFFLLLLLANALLFFWYAQRQAAAPVAADNADVAVGDLRLLNELDAGDRLPARERVCFDYTSLSSESEAQRLLRMLEPEPVTAQASPLPAEVVGWRLVLPLPADSARRIALLDELAQQGWVPESRGANLSFGSFDNRAALDAVRQQLPADIGARTRVLEQTAERGRWEVRVSHLAGYEISSEIKQLVLRTWPGIKVEKNGCEGVASPRSDK
ncbi:hypothetical protein [Marinobacterium lutimaris]|uniref:Sporulation related domain-containing protein n=1 Tax=Marinobacterium lutimaris TaxID=568106 RepID=A0A1H6CXZ7_9GAMM|nr:hypothetical protein [Marinobacterium lutimaris]SEG77677.1 hypothetical protein SAMN05444390_104287 [Marinobacterium lutimaris]